MLQQTFQRKNPRINMNLISLIIWTFCDLQTHAPSVLGLNICNLAYWMPPIDVSSLVSRSLKFFSGSSWFLSSTLCDKTWSSSSLWGGLDHLYFDPPFLSWLLAWILPFPHRYFKFCSPTGWVSGTFFYSCVWIWKPSQKQIVLVLISVLNLLKSIWPLVLERR